MIDPGESIRQQASVETIKMLPDFVPHNRIVFEYAELFKTTRPIKALKLRRVLGELRDIFVKQEFAFQRTRFTISKNGMAEALKIVCNKNFTVPLENHNYLKKVMVSISEKEGKLRSSLREKEILKREEQLRKGSRPGAPARSEDIVSPHSIGDVFKAIADNNNT